MASQIPDEIPSVLVCDVGNYAVHLACVKGQDVTKPLVLPHGKSAEIQQAIRSLWSAMPASGKLVASSVNQPAFTKFQTLAKQAVNQEALLIGRDIPLPIQTDLPDPSAIGTDRLCAALAAYDRLGSACVVADFGSAITIDCVNEEGVFLGGVILPGLRMSAEALHSRTAQLPMIEPAKPTWTFGKDTRQAIVSGIVFGARGALRCLVESYADYLKSWPLVIITGGDAELICPDLQQNDLVQAIVPDLVLQGVAAAYYRTLVS